MTYGQSILDLTYAFPCFFFYALACLFLGIRIMHILKIHPQEGMTLFKIGYLGGAFFIGQGIFGALWQTIAALGLFTPAIVVSIVAMAILSGVREMPLLFRLTLGEFKSIGRDTWNLGAPWVMIALLLILLISLFTILIVFPVGWDAVSYYAAQSKLIAITHRLTPLTDYEILAQCGLNAEMHAAVMFLLGGDIVGQYASQMTVWITALASAAILWEISSQVGLKRLGQWVVLVMLYTSTGFTFVMGSSDPSGAGGGKTDLYGAGLGLAAIYWLLQIGKLPNWVALFLSGLMAGFAINSKLSLIVVMAPMMGTLFVFYLWPILSSKNSQETPSFIFKFYSLMKEALVLGGSVLIAFLPLVFKNAIVFNEPLAPFFSFHQPQNIMLSPDFYTWYLPEYTRWLILTYPLALTLGQYPTQFGNLSPLLLAFVPLIILFSKYLNVFQNKPLTYLTLSSVFGIAGWILFYPSTFALRYFLPPLLTLLPLGGYVVEQIWQQRGNIILRLAMGFSIAAMLLYTISTLNTPLHKAHSYWVNSRNLSEGLWKSLSLANNKTEKGSRVFLAMYPRFALRSDLLQGLVSSSEVSSGSNIWETIYLKGGSSIVLDRLTHSKKFPPLANLEEIPNFLSVISHPIDDRYIVYQIVPKEGAPKPMKTSVEQKDGTWKIQKQS